MACEAWACRSQCTEAAELTPARLAAAFDDEIDGPLGQSMTGIANGLEHRGGRRRVAAARQQAGSDDGGDQHLPDLVALADDFELRLAAVAADDLGPRERNETGRFELPISWSYKRKLVTA